LPGVDVALKIFRLLRQWRITESSNLTNDDDCCVVRMFQVFCIC
jgi:hypothetical protein